MRDLLERVKERNSETIAFAIYFSVIAGISVLLTHGQALARYRANYWEVVAAYFAAALCVGTIVALLQPFATAIWRTYVIGILASIPVALIFRLTIYGLAPWNGRDNLLIPLSALAFGLIGTHAINKVRQKLREHPPRNQPRA